MYLYAAFELNFLWKLRHVLKKSVAAAPALIDAE